ncbi:aspartate:alanine exchanger family transporter [Alkalitalea saponilacus]|uniref:Putative transport protein n=1 Tax=Alkalitalea saponilacus TaxID=889453 RepID=A0A1T5DGM3_9BACT|nr:aspartate:alanine exchanger family transporter [Alkalitalea saponilacus]ASB50694.1 transporter [Alkalitalea saponilacus]SKB70862.1 putative transport protein [Alkalitalea saponilacus]
MEIFTTDYVAFFTIVALGIILGSVRIKGLSLDASAIIFVAMAFGHYGVSLPPIFQQVGLIFFMFSVGIQAGPGFFGAFSTTGIKLLKLSGIIIASALITTISIIYFFNVDSAMATGIFTGAITSASGLAAAAEIGDPHLIAIGFGLAYPFGIISIILFVRLSASFLRIDIQKEELKHREDVLMHHPEPEQRNFVVENPNVIGKTLSELNIRGVTHTNIFKILRDKTAITPTGNTTLERNDIIRASGTSKDLNTLSYFIGPATDIEIPESQKYIVRRFLISNRKNVEKTIADSHFLQNLNATVTAIRRAGVDLIPDAGTYLRLGDKVTISAPVENIPELSKMLGDSRAELDHLDFLPIAVGVLLGVFLGQLRFPIRPDVEFSLGLTGGVLIVALLLSKIGKTGPVVWSISHTTNQFLRKLGLLFFMAYIGTEAGKTLGTTVAEYGFSMIWMGALISLVPMISAVFFGSRILKINYLSVLGVLSGSMTSSPALSAVESVSKTSAPQEAYTTVYPISLVLIIILSQILVAL